MMRLAIFAGAAAMIIPAPGSAQSSMGGSPETGSLIKRRAAQINGTTATDARRTTRDFGLCVVKYYPKYGEQLAVEPIHTAEYAKLAKRVVDANCLSHGSLRMPANVVRTAIIEALYSERFGRTGPTDFSAVAAIDYLAGYPADLSGAARSVVALVSFGDCVSRKDAVNARGLVVSNPGSAAELERLSALSPSFNGCIVKGEKLTFSRSVIRGAVAEGLFRLSQVVRQSQAGAN